MAKRPPIRPDSEPPDIHEEMLRHLEEHPPQVGPPAPPPKRRPPRRAPAPSTARQELHLPTLMLRRLTLAPAIEALRRFLDVQRALGSCEVLIVVGKGRNSPGGEPVLRPQVEKWLRAHRDAVASVGVAPARLGGAGALLVVLRPMGGRGGVA